MAVDSRQQAPFHQMGYDTMRYTQPQFNNPWVSAPPTSHGQMYATSMPTSGVSDPSRYSAHAPVSNAYSSAPTSTSLASGMLQVDPDLYRQSGLQGVQDGLSATRPYAAPFTSTGAQGNTFAATSGPAYTSAPYGYQSDRRTSHPLVPSTNVAYSGFSDASRPQESALSDFSNRLNTASEAERQSFSDALDASRGMVAMSQSQTDITPRNIYGHSNTSGSSDAYGFPSRHSAHSSISSASTYPSYYNSSVSDAASVGDYSSASESIDMPTSRTLPRPHGLAGGAFPPAPQSMMGQFSSKVSSSSQKKHKCKICDKRFTRPSSLQTHMYSHTGEKRKFLNTFRQSSLAKNLQHLRVTLTDAGDTFLSFPTSGDTRKSTVVRAEIIRLRMMMSRIKGERS